MILTNIQSRGQVTLALLPLHTGTLKSFILDAIL